MCLQEGRAHESTQDTVEVVSQWTLLWGQLRMVNVVPMAQHTWVRVN